MSILFPLVMQADSCDCGPACLSMISKYYGLSINYEQLKNNCHGSRVGVSLFALNNEAQRLGFNTEAVQATLPELSKNGNFPCIAFWNQEHFIVIRKITKNKVLVADPGKGFITYSHEDFSIGWCNNDEGEGIALFLEKTSQVQRFSKQHSVSYVEQIIKYVSKYKHDFAKMAMLLLFTNCVQLAFPYITQYIVDKGINSKDINFIVILLSAQALLIISQAIADFFRYWTSLKINAKINISMISEFIDKLLHLPMTFFETKTTADILQRVFDFERIDSFINTHALSLIFSCSTLIMFSGVLFCYSGKILLIFLFGSCIYFGWIILFLNRRKVLDNCIFEQQAKTELDMIEIAEGASEIRTNNGQKYFRNKWEKAQNKIFELKFKQLALEQKSDIGSTVIIEGMNLFITFITASMVISETLTFGAMLAIQFVIGQLNSPLHQMINFINSLQDAKISFERIDSITNQDDENYNEVIKTDKSIAKGITLRNVSFAYDSAPDDIILNNISIHIPQNKTTAIVGASGSGKSTLLKLILQYYKPNEGEILINNEQLNGFSIENFRNNCGCVMQDGYIFTDTITRNIVPNNEPVDFDRLIKSVQTACIFDFIDSLPLKFGTKIGQGGISLSKGQKQRILIARAIYRDVKYLFFDEATNSLDAINEKHISTQLAKIFDNKTVIIIAHRLSTIKEADQIIVLNKGRVEETGSHQTLLDAKGYYYKLIQNQIDS
ncbi:MAG: peptidase domain-containing ABC transporter [Salinivirgaceae bacterium]|nr:peptidase domain-containing ABC transporter [Salinivirgaceae bacterium]